MRCARGRGVGWLPLTARLLCGRSAWKCLHARAGARAARKWRPAPPVLSTRPQAARGRYPWTRGTSEVGRLDALRVAQRPGPDLLINQPWKFPGSGLLRCDLSETKLNRPLPTANSRRLLAIPIPNKQTDRRATQRATPWPRRTEFFFFFPFFFPTHPLPSFRYIPEFSIWRFCLFCLGTRCPSFSAAASISTPTTPRSRSLRPTAFLHPGLPPRRGRPSRLPSGESL